MIQAAKKKQLRRLPVEQDVFHIKWNEYRKNIVALIDIFAKYESNAVIQSKTEKEDLKILDAWSDVLAPQLE